MALEQGQRPCSDLASPPTLYRHDHWYKGNAPLDPWPARPHRKFAKPFDAIRAVQACAQKYSALACPHLCRDPLEPGSCANIPRCTMNSRAPAGAGLVPASHVLLHRTHRTISAGTLLYARTSLAWLPSTKRPKPRRPCEAITMRSQPCFSAVAMIPSAGALSGT